MMKGNKGFEFKAKKILLILSITLNLSILNSRQYNSDKVSPRIIHTWQLLLNDIEMSNIYRDSDVYPFILCLNTLFPFIFHNCHSK